MLRFVVSTVIFVKTGVCLWLLVLFAILAGCADAGGVAMVLVPGDSVEIPEVSQTDDDSDIAESFPDEDGINIPPADPDEEDIPQEITDEDESEMDEDEPDLDENEPENDEAEVEEDAEPPLIEYNLFPFAGVRVEPCEREMGRTNIDKNNAVWSDGEGLTWFGALNGIWIYNKEPSPSLHCDEEVGEKVVCLDGRRVGDETELWAGFARGKVGRWRNGGWHFETVPEAIQDEVVTGDDAEELEEWQGMIWALDVHEDGTLAVQGPLGLALRDPSGVWMVADCLGVDWGMPVASDTTYYLKIDHLPFVGLRWMEDRLLAGANRTVVAIDKNSGTCEAICTTDEGQLAVAPGRTDRVIVGRSVQGGHDYRGPWATIYNYTGKVGECHNGIWRESTEIDDEVSTFFDLNTGLFVVEGSARIGIRTYIGWVQICIIRVGLHYFHAFHETTRKFADEFFSSNYCNGLGFNPYPGVGASFGLRQNLWFDEEEKHGWYSFGPSRIKLNR